jgi:hypothetical protein
MKATKATKLAVIPNIILMAVLAPLLAASNKEESFLKEKLKCLIVEKIDDSLRFFISDVV